MTDSIHEPQDQSQVNSRTNLFYLLQKLSGLHGTKGRESVADSPVSDEQIETYPRESDTLL